METRANYFIIGVFVLGLLGLLLGFIYWIKNDASGPAGKNYFVIFDGSVQGLTEASPVLFNGIRFGAVQSIELMPEDTRKVRALISVRNETPVRTNSKARISMQGLAGYVAMEITPGTPDAPLLQVKANEKYPVIYADAGSGGLLSGVSDAAGQANALLGHLNTLLSNNEDSLHHTITNIDAFTTTMAERKDDVAAVIQDLHALSGRLNEIAVKVDGAMDRIAGTSANGQDSVVSQVQQAVISFRQLAEKLDKSLGDRSAELTVQAERSLREFELLMKDTRRLADSLQRVVEKVERNPSGFLLGGQQSPKY
jgi:phospholipid/cholesterol/gamma-HCH transport system substrate-binding protein